jgi:hypothetical protein
MKFLTEKARLICKHQTGILQIFTFQDTVTIERDRVLVYNDPEFKPIIGCANIGPTIKPCSLSLVATKGYSDFIRIDGRAVCLDTITGLTEGTVPGTVKYVVNNPGQHFVTEE